MILSIETATSNCSVALHQVTGELIGVKELNEPNIHASKLFIFIQEIMNDYGVVPTQLKAIAVGMGPGSYTGLRIGVSAAKGLCYSMDIPLIAVNTLCCLSQRAIELAQDSDALYIPMLDARRMEVYTGVYNAELIEQDSTRALILESNSFDKWLNRTCYFFGDGMPKARPLYESIPNARFLDGILASAAVVGALACIKYQNQSFEDVAYFEPFYLKEFVSQSTFHKTSIK